MMRFFALSGRLRGTRLRGGAAEAAKRKLGHRRDRGDLVWAIRYGREDDIPTANHDDRPKSTRRADGSDANSS